jgi:hypothetical protein
MDSQPRRSGWQVFLYGLVILLILGFGWWGFCLYYSPQPGRPGAPHKDVWDSLFEASQLFLLNSGAVTPPVPWQLQLARWLAVALVTVALVRVVMLLVADRLLSLWLWRKARGHVVLCGLGRKARVYARHFRRLGRTVVVLENNPLNPLAEGVRDLGAVVLFGDATQPEALRRAYAERAGLLLCLCDDMTNLAITAAVERHLGERGRAGLPFTCFAHVADPMICRALQEVELNRKRGSFRREFFSVYQVAANALVTHSELRPFEPAARGQPVHLLLIGLGDMGLCLLLELLRYWRQQQVYWREQQVFRTQPGQALPRLRVSVVDPLAGQKLAALRGQFRYLDDLCELHPHDCAWSPAWLGHGGPFAADGSPPVTLAYVCPEDETVALNTALRLHRRGLETGASFPVVLQLAGNRDLDALLPGAPTGIRVFTLLEEVCTPARLIGLIERLAKGIHQRYLDGQKARNVPMGSRPALCSWEQLPERYRRSNMHQAERLVEMMETGRASYQIVRLQNLQAGEDCPFEDADLEEIARNEHERYRTEPGRQDDPQSVLEPWEKLSEEHRATTRRHVRDWPLILALLDFEIRRFPRAKQIPAPTGPRTPQPVP